MLLGDFKLKVVYEAVLSHLPRRDLWSEKCLVVKHLGQASIFKAELYSARYCAGFTNTCCRACKGEVVVALV